MNEAEPSASVCTPATAEESFVGILSTSTVKSMMHDADDVAPPAGPSTTALPGVNVTLPLASGALAVKAVPEQAVPARPVPLCTANTPVSISPPVHVAGLDVLPQDGVCVMLLTATFSLAFALVDWLVMVSDADRPVCPTVTGLG